MRRFSNTLPLFLLLSLFISLAACDSTGDDDDSSAIDGLWQDIEDQEEYLHVDLPEVESFGFFAGECYHEVDQVAALGNDLYAVENDSAAADTVRIFVEEGVLNVVVPGVATTEYERSDRSRSDLRAACED